MKSGLWLIALAVSCIVWMQAHAATMLPPTAATSVAQSHQAVTLVADSKPMPKKKVKKKHPPRHAIAGGQ